MKKICLTSHELGYYKQFYPVHSVQIRKKPPALKVVNENKSILFLYLEKMSDKNGIVVLSQKTVAEKLDVSVQTVRRWQQSLVSSGLLEKVEDYDPSMKKPTTYKIVRNRN